MTTKVFGYFAPALKGSKEIEYTPKYAKIEKGTDLYNHINKVFDSAQTECDIDVSFIPEKGKQINEVRLLVQEILRKNTIESALPLVKRLCGFTDQKTKDGLLFIIVKTDRQKKEICIARFPSETGIMVKGSQLELEFEIKDDVFLKNSRRYKAVLFEGSNIDTDYWDGKAIDKQINGSAVKDISDYWIRDFLKCDLKMTPERGSRIFARTMQKAVQNTNNEKAKQEIISASSLLSGKNGKTISINKALDEFNLSTDAKKLVLDQFDGNEKAIAEMKFKLDISEYLKYFNYRFVFMDNGAILVAASTTFDKVWDKEEASNREEVTYSTKGKVERTKIGSRL